MIILDTNVASEFVRVRPEPVVLGWFTGLEEDAYLTAVTIAELRLGLRLMPPGRRQRDLETVTVDMLQRFPRPTLPFDHEAADLYAELVAERHRIGRPIKRGRRPDRQHLSSARCGSRHEERPRLRGPWP